MTAVAVAIKMINQRPTRVLAVIVNARDVHEIIEPKLPFRERTDFADPFGIRHPDRNFAAKFRRFGD